MTYALVVVGLLVLGFVVIRVFFPEQLVQLIVVMWRKSARLSIRSAHVGDYTWHYLDGGPADAPVLLLVHGFGANKDSWIPYAALFTKKFRVIAPDMPGFGDSERRPDYNYRIQPQTERLAAFLDSLGIDRSHIAGNSMGGFIAGRLALDYPERVQTLTMIDNAGVESLNKSELELALEKGENPLVLQSMDQVDDLMEFISHKRIWIPAVVKQVTFAAAIKEQAFLDAIFWSLSEDLDNHSLTDELHRIATPTLIIWGRHDRVLDVSCAEVMAQRMPNNKCVILEETGHVPNMERPRETADAHLEFIDAQAGAALAAATAPG